MTPLAPVRVFCGDLVLGLLLLEEECGVCAVVGVVEGTPALNNSIGDKNIVFVGGGGGGGGACCGLVGFTSSNPGGGAVVCFQVAVPKRLDDDVVTEALPAGATMVPNQLENEEEPSWWLLTSPGGKSGLLLLGVDKS